MESQFVAGYMAGHLAGFLYAHEYAGRTSSAMDEYSTSYPRC